MSESRDILIRIEYNGLAVVLNEEGVAHSTDVLDDMCKRAVDLFVECLAQVEASTDGE